MSYKDEGAGQIGGKKEHALDSFSHALALAFCSHRAIL